MREAGKNFFGEQLACLSQKFSPFHCQLAVKARGGRKSVGLQESSDVVGGRCDRAVQAMQ